MVANTAAMYSRGEGGGSETYNQMWSGYLNNNFQAPQYQQQQQKFVSKNMRLNEAISNKCKKKMAPMKE